MLNNMTYTEYKATKEHVARLAVRIGLDELEELNAAYETFEDKVAHLAVYQHLYKDVINPYMRKLDADAQLLISKNYTAEELEFMTRESYNNILNQQKLRLQLLDKITQKYNLKESR